MRELNCDYSSIRLFELSGDNYLSVIVMIVFSLFVAIAIEAFNKLAVKEEVVEGGQPRQKRVSNQDG